MFSYNFVLRRLYVYRAFNHFLLLSGFYLTACLFFLGLVARIKFKRFENAFQKAGIKNSLGQHPKVMKITKMSDFRSKVRVVIDGVDPGEFESKTKTLETSIRENIESVVRAQEPQYIDLYITKRRLSKKVLYSEMCELLTSPYTFPVGESIAGPIIQDICSLPHMLGAGATGTGKSVFVKATTMGLLESSPAIQVYLLDLKRGLETAHFAACPNVVLVKEVKGAVALLRQVSAEMESRFLMLEKNGHNKLDPDRDNKDRIVVVIDEASVLYVESKVNQEEKTLSQEATEITDRIAKLSRAAGIHLVFATQKVTKETISTHIQENLEGRMCFEVNTLQGSNIVLGNGAAKDLPHIAGRGIWKVGATMIEVQTPLIEDEEIKRRCKVIAEEFESGKRKLHQEMFSPKETFQASAKMRGKVAKKKRAKQPDA